MPLEYRVRWEREGRTPKHRIYQSWPAARQKYLSIKAFDSLKADYPRIAETPDLVSVEMQSREVAAWSTHDEQPEVTEDTIRSIRDHYGWTEPSIHDKEPSTEVPF